MSVNAVQVFIKNTLDGLTTALTDLPAAKCWIAPPPDGADEGDLASAPQIYVLAGRWHEDRVSMSRGTAGQGDPNAGGKKVIYEMDIYIKYAESADDSIADSRFAVLIDAVQDALRKVTLKHTITDSTTGVSTDIVSIGETMEGTVQPVHALQGQRYRLWEAELIVKVEEYATA